jgi:isopentenyl-diphosphate delta-isomerase
MDHIQFALSTGQGAGALFDDIRIIHQALPDLGVEDIRIHTETGDLNLKSPVFINAMTGGGGSGTEKLNAILARAARETGVAMAVGSQMAAIKDAGERASYEIVRKENPDGFIIGNLGSEATVRQAEEAIEMIGANALQIHLNVIQELTMPEGDRDFKGALERIAEIADKLAVPVIVKETGFGISREAAEKLAGTKIAAVDVSGFGGTNFAAIENERRARKLSYFQGWGVPTAAAIIEAKNVFPKTVLASGGIKTAQEMVKAFMLGADGAGLAGSFLKTAVEHGESRLISEIESLQEDLRMMMTALGARDIAELQQCPAIITGELYHYLLMRGHDPAAFANRKKN